MDSSNYSPTNPGSDIEVIDDISITQSSTTTKKNIDTYNNEDYKLEYYKDSPIYIFQNQLFKRELLPIFLENNVVLRLLVLCKLYLYIILYI